MVSLVVITLFDMTSTQARLARVVYQPIVIFWIVTRSEPATSRRADLLRSSVRSCCALLTLHLRLPEVSRREPNSRSARVLVMLTAFLLSVPEKNHAWGLISRPPGSAILEYVP